MVKGGKGGNAGGKGGVLKGGGKTKGSGKSPKGPDDDRENEGRPFHIVYKTKWSHEHELTMRNIQHHIQNYGCIPNEMYYSPFVPWLMSPGSINREEERVERARKDLLDGNYTEYIKLLNQQIIRFQKAVSKAERDQREELSQRCAANASSWNCLLYTSPSPRDRG